MKKFLEMITQGDLVTVLKRYADIGLAVLVMLVVGMMIIPVPTPILDVLLVMNISISVLCQSGAHTAASENGAAMRQAMPGTSP